MKFEMKRELSSAHESMDSSAKCWPYSLGTGKPVLHDAAIASRGLDAHAVEMKELTRVGHSVIAHMRLRVELVRPDHTTERLHEGEAAVGLHRLATSEIRAVLLACRSDFLGDSVFAPTRWIRNRGGQDGLAAVGR